MTSWTTISHSLADYHNSPSNNNRISSSDLLKIKQLFALGARKLSLTGLSPMGCLPLERATNFMHPNNCVKEYNDLALEFNGKLKLLVAKLNELPGMKVLFANPYDLLLQLITAPSLYGFENAEEGCSGSGSFEMGILCTRDHPLTCTEQICILGRLSFH